MLQSKTNVKVQDLLFLKCLLEAGSKSQNPHEDPIRKSQFSSRSEPRTVWYMCVPETSPIYLWYRVLRSVLNRGHTLEVLNSTLRSSLSKDSYRLPTCLNKALSMFILVQRTFFSVLVCMWDLELLQSAWSGDLENCRFLHLHIFKLRVGAWVINFSSLPSKGSFCLTLYSVVRQLSNLNHRFLTPDMFQPQTSSSLPLRSHAFMLPIST